MLNDNSWWYKQDELLKRIAIFISNLVPNISQQESGQYLPAKGVAS